MLIGLLLLTFGLVGAFQAPSALTRKRYDGYKLISVVPVRTSTLSMLHSWLINDVKIDFWEEPSQLNKKVTFTVPPEHMIRVVTDLRRDGTEYTIESENIQDFLTPMWNEIDKRQLSPKAFNLNDYNTLTDLYAWMTSLAGNCRAGLTCQVYSLGNSYEGRPINIFKISKSGTGRKAYWIDATIHAREWITTATITNILNNLATGGDSNAVRLTDAYDWYILPVINVDGYEYTWTNDRLWRKNRKPSSVACFGTDLNRNFDFRWGHDGVSFQPCSETYCGPNGNSEPETVAVAAELVRLGPTLAATVTLHAYGNMWMFPWGNTVNYAGVVCDFADDNADLMAVADATANAIQATYNTRWDRGNSCQVIYATTGGTDDYAKGAAGVKYAFCPELRGNSFVIAASQIPLSYAEVWNGIVAMADTIGA
jgi:carboxypeptidase A2